MKKIFAVLVLSLLAFRGAAYSVEVQSYDQLLSAIRGVRGNYEQFGRGDIEKVRIAWETGKLINAYTFQRVGNEDRYKVVSRLTKDLNADDTEIYQMMKFARLFPSAMPEQRLTWTHYMMVLALDDPKEINELLNMAVSQHWTRLQLQAQIRLKFPI